VTFDTNFGGIFRSAHGKIKNILLYFATRDLTEADMKPIIFFILITSVAASAQIKEKLTFRLFGGTTLPEESFVGEKFEFAQFGDLLDIGESTSNFKDYWNSGLHIGGGFDYQIFENISAGIEVGASFFTLNETKVEDRITELFALLALPYNSNAVEIRQGGTDIYTLLLSVKASYPLTSVFTPYLSLNGGYMFVDQQAIKITYFDQPFGSSEDNLYFYDELPAKDGSVLTGSVGVGLQYQFLNTVGSFVEINYTLGNNTGYDNVGASTIILPVRFGMVFNFRE
jgi:opacity protein-like surface antigen